MTLLSFNDQYNYTNNNMHNKLIERVDVDMKDLIKQLPISKS